MKIEKRIVDAKRGVVQVTCPDERFYQITKDEQGKLLTPNDFYPSVTWITSFYPKGKGYENWLAEKGMDKAEEVKLEAGNKGSRVHKACGDLMEGREVKMDAKYTNADGELAELTAEEYGIIMTFRRFLEDEQPIILDIEYTLLNHEYQFAGTVDIKCRLKSDEYKFIHIVDIKTSKAIYTSHEIQVSAYKKTDPECDKIDILQVGYKLNKAGYKLTPIEDQFDVFLAAKRIWQKEQGNVVVHQREYPFSLKWKPLKEIPVLDVQGREKIVAMKKILKKKIIRKK